jgi:hypothetical protein
LPYNRLLSDDGKPYNNPSLYRSLAKQQLQVHFVSSIEQFADILTKELSASLFRTHCSNLRLTFFAPELEGGC